MCSCSTTNHQWHESVPWQRFLKLYDEEAQNQFGTNKDNDNTTPSFSSSSSSRLIPTRFGDTQIHTMGNPSHPTVLFFHGIGANSLMYGDWLMPTMASSSSLYCVAVDTLGDIGRSVPLHGNPKNVPQNEIQVAEWVQQIVTHLDLTTTNKPPEEDGGDPTLLLPRKTTKKISVIGYSLGSFIATCVAKQFPNLIDKVILMAPAGVVSSIQPSWIGRAILVGLISTMVGRDSEIANQWRKWFMEYMLVNPQRTPIETLPRSELRQAAFQIGKSQVGFMPRAMSIQELTMINEQTPLLLMIGQQETVIDPILAISNAQKANISTKVYEHVGHLLYVEHPREWIINDILSFLNK